MICLLSDIHGDAGFKGLERCPDDALIIFLGDMELNFRDTEENRRFTDWFLGLNKKIAVMDGNHENHPYMNSFPEEEWNGGRVHRLTESIIHLERGYVYDIEGKSFFVMGGCKSSQKWYDAGLVYGGEAPDAGEIQRGYESLAARGDRVDYVLTHKYKAEEWRDCEPERLSLAGICRYIDENVSFTHWYTGHWHKNRKIDDTHTIVYDEPVFI